MKRTKATTLILCCAVFAIAARAETAEGQDFSVFMKVEGGGVSTNGEGPPGDFQDFLVCEKTYFGLFREDGLGAGGSRPAADTFTCRASIGPSTGPMTAAFIGGDPLNVEIVATAPAGGPGQVQSTPILEVMLQQAVLQRVRVSGGGEGVPVVQYDFQIRTFELRAFGGSEVGFDFERSEPL
ncbi:MAG: hypothetical protein AAF997_16385, partial [Myxococcota bacterium]